MLAPHVAASLPPQNSLAPHVAVDDLGLDAALPQPPADLLRQRDAAVLAPCTADRNGDVALALPPVALGDDLQQVGVTLQELPGAGLGQHVPADLRVQAGPGP